MYRIRLHGRGGQGIKTSTRVLGSAFFYEGFAVQDAPVYGAERRGAPMVGYVRAAGSTIRERGTITNPDLVVVADDSLIRLPAANVLAGLSPRTVLLIATSTSAEEWRRRLHVAGPIVTIPDGSGSSAAGSVPCAGAAARLVGRVGCDALARAIRDELRGVSPAIVDANIERAFAAYDALAPVEGIVTEGDDISPSAYSRPEWVDLPFDLVPVAAPDIRAPVTSLEVPTGAWRTTRPVIDRDRCNRCTWVCSTLCPDSAIRVTADGRPEIDYDHCKGCLVCVAVCPPHAIQAIPEQTMQEVPL